MTLFLAQSAAATFRIGPFVDEADGFTPETSLTLTQADFRLSKAGGAFAQKNDTTGGTHDENGWYTCVLNATDTNTAGNLTVAVYEAGARPVKVDIHIIGGNGVVANNSNVTTVGNNTVVIYGLLDTEIAAILEDTNELQADLADGGRLDLLMDAIKAKTDNLPNDTNAVLAALPDADAVAEAVMESTIDASDDTTPAPAATFRRRLRQLWQTLGR